MERLKKGGFGLAVCLFELIVGILLMINPVGFTSAIVAAAGMFLMLYGLLCVISYARTGAEQAAAGHELTKGLAFLLLGGVCAFRSGWLMGVFPVLTVMYGAGLLLTSLFRIQRTADLLRLKKSWALTAAGAGISFACGTIILLDPFASSTVLWMIAGASLIADAVLDAMELLSGRRKI